MGWLVVRVPTLEVVSTSLLFLFHGYLDVCSASPSNIKEMTGSGQLGDGMFCSLAAIHTSDLGI